MASAAFTLATYEPYNSIVHGGIDTGELLIMYDYTLDEFYNNSWKSELKFYKKRVLSLTRNRSHALLRNYNKIIQKSQMELVEIYQTNDVMYCILHTYKINILKKKWKNRRYQI
jgi:hypothetical protein